MGQGSSESTSQEGTPRTDRKASDQVQRGLTRSSLGQYTRLRKRSEVARVRNSGRRIAVPYLTAWRTDSASTRSRVAITVPLHGNSAVARNRLRRRLWHLIREEMRGLERGAIDILVNARATAYAAAFDALRASVRRVLDP